MGCDIDSFVEVFDGEKWTWLRGDLFPDAFSASGFTEYPFDRYYPLFGFLAGVRDNSAVPQIAPGRHGLPPDASKELRAWFGFMFPYDCPHEQTAPGERQGCMCVYHDSGWFGHCWATGVELLEYDYEQTIACPYAHEGDGNPVPVGGYRCERTDGLITVAEYISPGWVDRCREIAHLRPDPRMVRVVYAFNT